MPGWLTGILAAKDALMIAKEILSLMQKNKDEPWYKEMIAALQAQRNAQTPEDRRSAAEKSRDLLNTV